MAPVQRKGLRALELWCRRVTDNYPNVNVIDLSTSFRDGLAFNAIIHHFRPHLFDFASLKKENILENNAHAFKIAEEKLNIPALLDPEDMVDTDEPDKFSVATYLAQFYHLFKDEKVEGCNTSFNSTNTSLTRLSSESENDSVVHSCSSAEGTPSTTPSTTRQTRIFNRQDLIDKYGEDIFSTSSPTGSHSSGDEKDLSSSNDSKIQTGKVNPSRNASSPKAVASVCRQFEMKAKIGAS